MSSSLKLPVKKPPADAFYLGARVAYAFCWALVTTLSLVYLVVDVGLDPLQMVLVGTVLEASVFLFEIPTGVVADLVSRRLSVIIGHVLMGLGWLWVALVPEFAAVLLAQVVWGVGATFLSGAYAAWLSQELGRHAAGPVLVRAAQWGHAAAIAGIAAAVWLGTVDLALPLLVGSIGFLAIGLTMMVWMPEARFQAVAAAERAGYRAMVRTLGAGLAVLNARPVLWTVLLVVALYGLFSEGMDRLFTPFLIEGFAFPPLGSLDDVVWWGVLAGVAHVLGFAATGLVRRVVVLTDQDQLLRAMMVALAGVALCVLALANAAGFGVVVLLYWLAGACRSAYGPLMTAWLNELLPERYKATLFSMYGQADAIGQVLGGPLVGYVAKARSIRVGLSLSAMLLMPSGLLLRRAQRQLAAARLEE